MITLGGIGIAAIAIIASVAIASGVDGTLVKIAFAGIGAIVAGLGGYTIGIKRKQ